MRLILVVIVLCAFLCHAKDLTVGTRVNNLLINTEKLVVKPIIFLRREKTYSYVDPKQRTIKGIIARDLSRTKAEPTITAGGVGEKHVSIHFKSERGEGINYLILIFSNNV
ncbi:uncharacterized protein LOC125242262 [Leguminivora glycinivorella]|uniref:uncharacterized protein LOC125242262 n=1 Tax=Leguminivora glycinivorella TaxID=1035111 RepID=UPI00200CF349|nr:uncharacterized protein LOC125242262 [Leguminivora glycinivorella]